MVGITSYGGYIPRYRLNRMVIVQNMSWLLPPIMAVAQGEKSVANWDEDALTMAVAAGYDCMTGKDRKSLDAIYLASTTLPYQDRLNAGIVSTALNAPEEGLTAVDFCSSRAAGVSASISAMEAVQSGSKSNVLVLASDQRRTKMGTMYEMFLGDGAAALLFGKEDLIAEVKGSHSHTCDFVDQFKAQGKDFDYVWEERWTRDEGYVKIIPEAISGYVKKNGEDLNTFDKVIFPCYFRREHAAIAKKLGLDPSKVQDNMHDVCGDTGTAHPLVMFIAALEEAKPGDKILMASFGQGCDIMGFEVTDKIKDFKGPKGIKGSLSNKADLDSYQRYGKFRDLIVADLGLRSEIYGNTALTTLWRKRKVILGLVGGKCTKCGTPQFVPQDICVNPDCNALHTLEDYEFALRDGKVLSYTGDMLAASVDPPAVYGIISFNEGGRMFCDFTDCVLDQVKVNQPIKMTFRIKKNDNIRGYRGYFWKAIPQIER